MGLVLRRHGLGWDFLHVCVDDASRLAYSEILPDERQESAVAFLGRALAWFAGLGVTVERVMTDNGSAYRSRAYALPYPSADSRAADLPRWLAWYHTDRPHAGLAGPSPATMLTTAT